MIKTLREWLRVNGWWCFLLSTSLVIACLFRIGHVWLNEEEASTSNVEEWSKLSFHPDTVGVLGVSSNNSLIDYRGMIDGAGILCSIEFGRSVNGTTGGTYEMIILQLPISISEGETIELIGHKQSSEDFRKSKISEMSTGEVYVSWHRSPSTFSSCPTESSWVTGKALIIAIGENKISIHLQLEAKVFDRIDSKQSSIYRMIRDLELKRSFLLDSNIEQNE